MICIDWYYDNQIGSGSRSSQTNDKIPQLSSSSTHVLLVNLYYLIITTKENMQKEPKRWLETDRYDQFSVPSMRWWLLPNRWFWDCLVLRMDFGNLWRMHQNYVCITTQINNRSCTSKNWRCKIFVFIINYLAEKMGCGRADCMIFVKC